MSVLNDNQKSDYTEIKSLKELTFFKNSLFFIVAYLINLNCLYFS